MKKYYTILILAFGLISCDPKSYVSFTVNNAATSKLFVHYEKLATDDTLTVTIDPNFSNTIWETTRSSEESNWFFDYAISIKWIVNENSDTIKINPNISQYWVLYVGDPYYDYAITIKDSLF